MKFVIFGGTAESRMLSLALAEAGAEVTVCVASAYGHELQSEVSRVETRTGPFSAEEKAGLLRDAVLCVDATHPYATHIKQSVREACAAAGVRCVRLQRKESEAETALWMDSASDAAGYLVKREGNILLTTGAKELPAFSAIDPGRLFPRVLPSHESLSACEASGIPHRNIIAMQGPFSREMNEAILRQFSISWLVTKDGGEAGGFPEKAEAARNTGVTMIALRRPNDSGMSYDDVLHLCVGILQGKSQY
ncbi:MAG: precorrin-6A reductase [Oscillospiraceae bacterium]|nr:precorrin-6A reductase [Oscillospiraceae bacterium]